MKRLLIVLVFAISGFAVGYGATAMAWPIHGRSPYYGYFQNRYDSAGWEVLPRSCSGAYNYWNGNNWCNSIPNWLDTPGEFISYIEDRANGGYSNQATTGAQFIIHTIIGSPDGQRYRPPQGWQYQRFRDIINGAAADGRISWSSNYNFNLNSFWQGGGSGSNYNDDAFYNSSGNGSAIIITNPSGGNPYVIRRQCANPVGLNDVSWVREWTMQGVSAATNLTNGSRNPNVFVGDRIQFTHTLQNLGPSDTGQDIWFEVRDQSGNVQQWGQSSGSYTAGQLKTVDNDEIVTVPAVPAGTQICRRIFFIYSDSNGGSNVSNLACVTVTANFSLTPHVDIEITDSAGQPVTGKAQPGDTVRFRYWVENSLPGTSSGTNCTIYGLTRTGYYPVPNPHDSTSDPGFVQPAHGCPRNFPPGNTNLVTETLPAASVVANRSICRSLFVNPASQSGGSASAESCVYVVSKPYSRVYGGDIAAGGGVETAPGSCSTSPGAAIIGWNKRGAPNNYGGAGAQYAAYALSTIFDTATSLGNGSGAAPPTSLAFANTGTNAASGRFGTNWGSAPCIRDHFATLPAGAAAMPANVNGLASGAYRGTGNFQLGGGTITAGTDVSIYVDGNLFIAGNIVYGGNGSWTSGTIPSLRLIVRGNIFIDNDVSQLDGLYVAQPNGASGGIVYTCALNTAPFTPMALNGTLASQCDNAKLTVNGGVVARQVYLLRTIGTVAQSNGTELNTSSNIAEVFNYNPALWIVQPTEGVAGAEYDAINSLPPVL